ncbi:hypothetical protein [Mesoplasma entomophilum]|uniref:ABC transporter substrate-binding protein n=1 Tax=Mesoplasma entomophilum TaxID=2149 RepID=A0A3S5XYQ3_9MOLU|nr:hypothetical protein [Mesoplasma entomophilum]ATQ35186.1 hypothetical protein CS528_00105 [Mesoplasma entomophilum]
MKKLLLTLSSTLILATTGMSVVSCTVKPEKEVILLLPGESIGSGSTYIQDAYREIANQFNKDHENDENFVPVKVVWKPSGTIQSAILSGDNLPDLYVSYPDQAALYKSTKLANKTRDMKVSMIGNDQDKKGIDAWNNFNDDLISPSFLKEGQYNNEQLVLPFGKSFDVSVINVNLFIDYLSIYDENAAETIKSNYEDYNKNNRAALTNSKGKVSDISFFNKSLSRKILEITPETTRNEGPAKWAKDLAGKTDVDLISGIREIFKDIDKVLKITSDYNKLDQYVKTHPNQNAIDVKIKDATWKEKTTDNPKSGSVVVQGNKSINKNYAFAIDSLANKFLMDYSAKTGNEIINTTDKDNNFFYSVEYAKQSAQLILNNEWEGSENTLKYLDGMWDIAYANKNWKNSSVFTEQWDGVFATSVSEPKKIYTSTYFANGTTFMAAGSSAGSYNFTKNSYINDQKPNEWGINADKNIDITYSGVKNADIITAPSTSGVGTGNAFMSQGPGIAGSNRTGQMQQKKKKQLHSFYNIWFNHKFQLNLD